MNDEEQEKAHEELKEFKKEFAKLMSNHPNVDIVSSNINGDLMAYHSVAYNTKIYLE